MTLRPARDVERGQHLGQVLADARGIGRMLAGVSENPRPGFMAR